MDARLSFFFRRRLERGQEDPGETGKDVRALTQLPATKGGVKVCVLPPGGKDWDQRGLNAKHLARWLKERADFNDPFLQNAVIQPLP